LEIVLSLICLNAVVVAIQSATRRAAIKVKLRPSNTGWFIHSEDIHPLGVRESSLASGTIIPSIKPPGSRHRRGELRLQFALRFFYRCDRRLVIVLRGNRLGRHQSRVGITGGLTDRCFELRYVGAAGTGLGECRGQAQSRAKNKAGRYPAISEF
jgi:hypothetical protein